MNKKLTQAMIALTLCLTLASCSANSNQGTANANQPDAGTNNIANQLQDSTSEGMECTEVGVYQYEENPNGGNYIQNTKDYKFGFGPDNEENPITIKGDTLSYDMYFVNGGDATEWGIMMCIDGIPVLSTVDGKKAVTHMLSLEKSVGNAAPGSILRFSIDLESTFLTKDKQHSLYPIVILEPNHNPQKPSEITHEGSLNSHTPISFEYISKGVQLECGNLTIPKKESIFKKNDKQLYSFNNSFSKEDPFSELDATIQSTEIKTDIVSDGMNIPIIKMNDIKNGTSIEISSSEEGTYNLFFIVNNEVQPIPKKAFFEDDDVEKLVLTDISQRYLIKGHKRTEPVPFDINETLKNGDQFYFLLLPVGYDNDPAEAWPHKTKTYYIRD